MGELEKEDDTDYCKVECSVNNNYIVIYDLNSCPIEEGWNFDKVLDIMKSTGYLLYDGRKGNAPNIFRKY